MPKCKVRCFRTNSRNTASINLGALRSLEDARGGCVVSTGRHPEGHLLRKCSCTMSKIIVDIPLQQPPHQIKFRHSIYYYAEYSEDSGLGRDPVQSCVWQTSPTGVD